MTEDRDRSGKIVAEPTCLRSDRRGQERYIEKIDSLNSGRGSSDPSKCPWIVSCEVKTPAERTKGTSTQVGIYAVVMLTAGVGFFIWARQLRVPSPVILGSLLIIEGLGGVIVSLTEWWRLSHIGVSLGLMIGGFLLPFAGTVSVGVPVGGALLLGSLLSAGVLYCQLRHHAASHTDRAA